MLPSLATREKLFKKMFLNEVKNIFASRTQILLLKHMFPSLATEETILLAYPQEQRNISRASR